jgi:hypothetical protein
MLPHGIDDLPQTPIDKSSLLKAGWVQIQVGKHPDRKYSLGNNGLSGSREQYGLKHRISLTIHSIMGCTVPTLVTEVGLSREMGYLRGHDWVIPSVVPKLCRRVRRRGTDLRCHCRAGRAGRYPRQPIVRAGDRVRSA